VTSAAPWTRGRLSDPAGAPVSGEIADHVARIGGVIIEEIRSGAMDSPIDYCADVDEWVVIVAGAATLVVDGETLQLEPGDWVLLPAGTPHTLMRTELGTQWITVTATVAD
jgi:cupin 2 domain-containing protein